ncbi:2-dehydro-3-deoxygluconokinase [Stackebrandtia albiflava]|uniref:2-dehydro-3-deoxygluconokinase n=1 Tax=Stackebrandtia albiflava TaxID=406432 RepID=A0A562VDT3_9ACTN|nr:sugar kinase [Stackebrandtia albiflava]TWJ16025.1 2-dehydro-3-deoxygluconokinase [Stackebrandtia albiflava]
MASPTTAIDVVCLGESMALVSPDVPGPLCEGTPLRLTVAGAESNVAVNLAGLGARVAWHGRVGADPFGTMIVDRLTGAGVSVPGVQVDGSLPTGVYFKDPHGATVHYYRRGSAAAAMTPGFAAGLPDGRILHLSGITPALSETCGALVSHLVTDRPHPGLLSFDVNHRAKLWPSADEAADTLHRLAAGSDLVFVGRDEAETLWGTTTPAAVRRLLPGPATLVVKDADIGATAFTGDTEVFAATPPVTVVEPVGAGDAFAAGYLYGTLRGASPSTALRLGHLTAAAALSVPGDIGPPPGPDTVARLLSEGEPT